MEEILYCCRFEDFSDDPELLEEFLAAQEFFYGIWEDRENPRRVLTVYARTEEEGQSNLARINRLLPLWRQYGAKTGKVEYFRLEKTDWSEAWKKYFHIIHVSPRLVIKPSWLEYDAKPEQVILQIDPGMSFGTGQHATTAFCLRTLDALADRRDAEDLRHVLDAGCGSGILSIAAKLLGYEFVECFDNDPDCMTTTRENAERNRVELAPFVADAANYPGREGGCDIVAANILGHLLMQFRDNIVRWVKPGKYLILSGILTEEFDEVSRHYCEKGFTELERGTEKEWTSGLFRKNN